MHYRWPKKVSWVKRTDSVASCQDCPLPPSPLSRRSSSGLIANAAVPIHWGTTDSSTGVLACRHTIQAQQADSRPV